jgi:hypothetical protein
MRSAGLDPDREHGLENGFITCHGIWPLYENRPLNSILDIRDQAGRHLLRSPVRTHAHLA